MSKTKAKAPVVYAFVLYGGIITKGYTYVKITNEHPESEEYEKYKEFYGDDVKGRYVKCAKDFDEVKTAVAEALAEQLQKRSDEEKEKLEKEK